MGAVSEMEVLMVSVLEESRSALPGECRFYDGDLHKSEVTGAHTGIARPVLYVFWEFTETGQENFSFTQGFSEGFFFFGGEGELAFLH